jgi:phosphoglycolate phosphatase-like HAD superfamily hydrolase
MPCNLLVLDIDGTLVDSVRWHREALRRSIESAALLHRDTRWSNYRHRTDSGIFAEAHERSFGVEPPVQACQAFERLVEREYEAWSLDKPKLIPGALELTSWARSSPSWRVVFATGSFRAPAVRKLGLLHGAVPVLVTASEYRSRREIVSNAIAAGWSGMAMEDRGIAVCVGDGEWDAQTARDLGLPFIGIACESQAQALYRRGAVAVLPDCRGVWQQLEQVRDRCEAT